MLDMVYQQSANVTSNDSSAIDTPATFDTFDTDGRIEPNTNVKLTGDTGDTFGTGGRIEVDKDVRVYKVDKDVKQPIWTARSSRATWIDGPITFDTGGKLYTESDTSIGRNALKPIIDRVKGTLKIYIIKEASNWGYSENAFDANNNSTATNFLRDDNLLNQNDVSLDEITSSDTSGCTSYQFNNSLKLTKEDFIPEIAYASDKK